MDAHEDDGLDEPGADDFDDLMLEMNVDDADAPRLDDFLTTSQTFDVAGFGMVRFPIALTLNAWPCPCRAAARPRPFSHSHMIGDGE